LEVASSVKIFFEDFFSPLIFGSSCAWRGSHAKREAIAYDQDMANVILCDAAGNELGIADLLQAHTGEGRLHRAFSVYVFSPDRRELLIQQRSAKKMLWPLIWANTCCSHPRPGETPLAAATRRTQEELGFCCPLTVGPSFVYRAVDPAGRGVEHEHLTILVGEARPEVRPNPDEVVEWKWVDVDKLRRGMAANPEAYAPWFRLGLERLVSNTSG
jgi:isopentenyl-diphosphate delta-isomerase